MIGVAQYEGRIYVAYESSRQLSVFSNVAPHEEINTIRIDGLHRVHDMVVCTESRQLFVADWYFIWRIADLQSSDESKTTVSCMKTSSRVWTMSTKHGSLVTTSPEINGLHVYKTTHINDNQPSEWIALPEQISPIHATATKDQNFVICHVPYSSTNESGIECYYQVCCFLTLPKTNTSLNFFWNVNGKRPSFELLLLQPRKRKAHTLRNAELDQWVLMLPK